MRKAGNLILNILRVLVVVTFLILVIDFVEFLPRGEYFLYYRFLKDAAPDPTTYMSLIDRIYNIEKDSVGIMFTIVWFPIVALINIMLIACDGYRSRTSKLSFVRCLLEIILLILTLLMHV